jgi:hypothetical protein
VTEVLGDTSTNAPARIGSGATERQDLERT